MWLPCWLHPQSPLLSSFALWSPSLQPTREVCGLSLFVCVSLLFSLQAWSMLCSLCVSAAGLEHALQFVCVCCRPGACSAVCVCLLQAWSMLCSLCVSAAGLEHALQFVCVCCRPGACSAVCVCLLQAWSMLCSLCVSAAGLEHALQCLAQEDPSLRVSVDQDTGQVHSGHPYTVS